MVILCSVLLIIISYTLQHHGFNLFVAHLSFSLVHGVPLLNHGSAITSAMQDKGLAQTPSIHPRLVVLYPISDDAHSLVSFLSQCLSPPDFSSYSFPEAVFESTLSSTQGGAPLSSATSAAAIADADADAPLA